MCMTQLEAEVFGLQNPNTFIQPKGKPKFKICFSDKWIREDGTNSLPPHQRSWEEWEKSYQSFAVKHDSQIKRSTEGLECEVEIGYVGPVVYMHWWRIPELKNKYSCIKQGIVDFDYNSITIPIPGCSPYRYQISSNPEGLYKRLIVLMDHFLTAEVFNGEKK